MRDARRRRLVPGDDAHTCQREGAVREMVLTRPNGLLLCIIPKINACSIPENLRQTDVYILDKKDCD